MSAVCRWAILGTAGIARKNWHSIRNAENAELIAVASRSQERARQFIVECQAQVPHPTTPIAVGGYDELLARDDIDAVYVPLPTGIRKEWVIKAAQAGKHVMCEKPCGVVTADVEEIIAACDANHVQFMDGVMFMHSRRLGALRETLDDGRSIGQLRRIATGFSFNAPQDFLEGNIRVSSALEPAGCLGDLGWYNIRFTLWVMNYAMPRAVTGRLLSTIKSKISDAPTPTEFSGELLFDGGVSAGFYCSFLTEHQQWAHISGSKGHAVVSDFVLPFMGPEVGFDVSNHHFDINNCLFHMEQHTRRVAVNEYSNNHATSQETNLFRSFSTLVLSGSVDRHWPDIALKTQQVLDACLDSARSNSRPVEL
ncbi:gfo/Idh/MocA family oxidoreductase [bacterium]|nr:gfo/Idh/MocA family oxidoreductase [bacterium]